MRLFECRNCGQLLYFENTRCERCGHFLGYVPDAPVLSTLTEEDGDRWRPLIALEQVYRFCANAAHEACNWLVPATAPDAFYQACRLNRTIPDSAGPSTCWAGSVWKRPSTRGAAGGAQGNIWGVGLPMSETADTFVEHGQFMAAYEADYVTRDGRLVIDEPEIRQKLIKTIDSYMTIYRRGCTPPDSITWNSSDNNKQFLARKVVIAANISLSIPNALKRDRPEDYYEHVATIKWPLRQRGDAFPIYGDVFPLVVFKKGGNAATAEKFIRFLVTKGWLAHYLDFSGERLLPPMRALLVARL
jgi:zinc-ribbon domain